MADFPVFAVSLKDSGRRAVLAQRCAEFHLNVRWVDAVDFRGKTAAEAGGFYLPTERAVRRRRLLSAPEIGCALSHRKIYRTMLAQNLPAALVLEDDVCFLENPRPLLENWQEIYRQVKFDVLILGYVKTLPEQLPYYYRRIPLKTVGHWGKYRLGIPWEQYGCGAVAYLLTQQGARKLLSEEKVRTAADDWRYFAHTYGLQVLHLRPAAALEDIGRFCSSIRTEKAGFLKPKISSVIIRSLKGWLKNFGMNVLGMKGGR